MVSPRFLLLFVVFFLATDFTLVNSLNITTFFPEGGIAIREDVTSSFYGYVLRATSDSTNLQWTVGTSQPTQPSTVTWGFSDASGDVAVFGYAISGSSAPFDYDTNSAYIVPILTTDGSSTTVTNYLVVSITRVNEAPIINDKTHTVSIALVTKLNSLENVVKMKFFPLL